MKKKGILVILVIGIWIINFMSSVLGQILNYDLEYDDPSEDIVQFFFEDDEFITRPVSGHEDIDILKISSAKQALGINIILKMEVSGLITDSETISYSVEIFDSSDEFNSYSITYTNGSCYGYGFMQEDETELDATGAGTNTLEITLPIREISNIDNFDIMGRTTEMVFSDDGVNEEPMINFESYEDDVNVPDYSDIDGIDMTPSDLKINLEMEKVNEIIITGEGLFENGSALRQEIDREVGNGDGLVTQAEVNAYEIYISNSMADDYEEDGEEYFEEEYEDEYEEGFEDGIEMGVEVEESEDITIDNMKPTNDEYMIEIKNAEGSVESTEPLTMSYITKSTYNVQTQDTHTIKLPGIESGNGNGDDDDEEDAEMPFSELNIKCPPGWNFDDTNIVPSSLSNYLNDDKTMISLNDPNEIKINMNDDIILTIKKVEAKPSDDNDDDGSNGYTPGFEGWVFGTAIGLILILVILKKSKRY